MDFSLILPVASRLLHLYSTLAGGCSGRLCGLELLQSLLHNALSLSLQAPSLLPNHAIHPVLLIVLNETSLALPSRLFRTVGLILTGSVFQQKTWIKDAAVLCIPSNSHIASAVLLAKGFPDYFLLCGDMSSRRRDALI